MTPLNTILKAGQKAGYKVLSEDKIYNNKKYSTKHKSIHKLASFYRMCYRVQTNKNLLDETLTRIILIV